MPATHFFCGAIPRVDVCQQDLHLAERLPNKPVTCDVIRLESAQVDGAPRALGELIEHIVTVHHAYVRRELVRLRPLLLKIVKKHTSRRGALADLPAIFNALASRLDQQMDKEEKVLFPRIELLEREPRLRSLSQPRLALPLGAMAEEHDFTREALARMRWISGDYQLTADDGATVALLYTGLAAFEANWQRHIDEETSILFPRAIALEAKLTLSL